jgi:hypothetical protein
MAGGVSPPPASHRRGGTEHAGHPKLAILCGRDEGVEVGRVDLDQTCSMCVECLWREGGGQAGCIGNKGFRCRRGRVKQGSLQAELKDRDGTV